MTAFENQIYNQVSCSNPDFLSNISFEKPLFFHLKTNTTLKTKVDLTEYRNLL